MIDNQGILKPNGAIQLRGGTYEALRTQNPLLSRREIMTEVDTGRLKVGDGIHRWNDLAYTSDIGNMSIPTLMLNFESGTEIVLGSQKEIVITTNSDGKIEVTSSDNSIVKVITETSIDENLVQYISGYYIQGVEAGNATITVRVKASENYFAIEKSFDVTVKSTIRYGYRINKNESDPYNRVEYLYDAVGLTPAHMDFANGVFDYGDWGDKWFITDNKPCMLKSDGTVDYYLNPNDYTKKEDGTASDVANTAYNGNAMAQIPLVWVYRYEDENYEYEIISDKQVNENYKAYAHTRADGSIADYFYWSMFPSTGSASKIRSLSGQSSHVNAISATTAVSGALANGNRWYIHTWSGHELIRTLLILMSKSTNVNSVFGMGRCDNNSVLETGTLKNKGQFYGYADSSHQVKVFHIERAWSEVMSILAGLIIHNSTYYVKMTREGTGYQFTNVNGYTNTGIVFSNVINGYVTKVKCCEYGMFNLVVDGSASTYYCDGCYCVNMSLGICAYGGYRMDPAGNDGIFTVSADRNNSTVAIAPIGYGLTCEQPLGE